MINVSGPYPVRNYFGYGKSGLGIFISRFMLGLVLVGFLSSCCAASPLGKKSGNDVEQEGVVPEVLVYADTATDSQTDLLKTVIVDKSTQQAILFAYDNQWREIGRWSCTTGKEPGRKLVEGDLKTPEGIYFATRQVDGRFLTETYGSRALPLDYPNWLDQKENRTGSAIWLHGTNKTLRPKDSNGCIVFRNRDIDALAGSIELNKTPVIVVNNVKLQPRKEADLISKAVLFAASRWNSALMGGSYNRLKHWYIPGAEPTMAWWHRWCRFRHMHAITRGAYGSLLKKRAVYRYDDVNVLIFDHYLSHKDRNIWIGRHKLFMRIQGHQVRILNDSYLDKNDNHLSSSADDPLFSAWEHLWRLAQRGSDAEPRPAAGDAT